MSAFYRWKNGGSGRLTDLLKFSQLVRTRTGLSSKSFWSTVPCLLDTMPSNQRTCRVDSGMSPPCALTPYHPSSCVLSSSTFLCVLLESFPHPSQSVGPLEVLIPYSSYLYCDFQNLFVCFHSGPVICPFVFLFSAKAAEEHSTVPCM